MVWMFALFRPDSKLGPCGAFSAPATTASKQLLPSTTNFQQLSRTSKRTMTAEHESGAESMADHDDPLADPEERRVLHAAFDSFRYVSEQKVWSWLSFHHILSRSPTVTGSIVTPLITTSLI